MTAAKHILRLVSPPSRDASGVAADPCAQRPGPELDDGAVVAGTLAGDPAAALILYQRHQENVRRLLWQLLGPDPELEDMLQQVFLEVAASLHRLAKTASLGSWIVGITVHTARREIRRRQRWRRHRALEPEETPTATAPTSAGDHQRVSRIFEILDTLPASERVVFVLRFAEGYRLAEIATACDCSLATVKRRIRKARNLVYQQAQQDFWLSPLLSEDDNV